MALNKQFLKEINVVLDEIGCDTIETDAGVKALEGIILRIIKGITTAVSGLPASARKSENNAEEEKAGSGKGTRNRRTRTRSEEDSDGYFAYWKERITNVLDACQDAGVKKEALAHLRENDALYNRNSTEKQMKRTFAILMDFCRDNAVEVGETASVGSRSDDDFPF